MLSNWVLEHLLQLTGKPYIEFKEDDNSVTRLFSSWTKSDKFKWHMDDEDRTIRPLHKTDWLFQIEDQLPVPLDGPIFIRRHQWHRLIKGTRSLTLKITKHE